MKNVLLLIFFCCLFFNLKAFSFDGKFIVPIEDQELISYSRFNVHDIEITPDYLRVTMPPELASDEAYSLKFERNNDGINRLNSFFGSAHCLQESDSLIKCRIKYNKLYRKVLIKNLWKTMDYIQYSTSGIEELTNRLLIAEWFAGHPEGILLINLDRD